METLEEMYLDSYFRRVDAGELIFFPVESVRQRGDEKMIKSFRENCISLRRFLRWYAGAVKRELRRRESEHVPTVPPHIHGDHP